MHAETRLQVKKNKAFAHSWKTFLKIEVLFVFVFNVPYRSLRINRRKYRVQRDIHGRSEEKS